MCPLSCHLRPLAVRLLAALALLLGGLAPASAAMMYALSTTTAPAGGALQLQGTLFNETPDTLNWRPPKALAVVWIDSDGRRTPAIAALESTPERIDLPVNNFSTLSWQVPVPKHAGGLMALEVDGATTLLALQVEAGAGTTGSAPYGTFNDSTGGQTTASGRQAASAGLPGAGTAPPATGNDLVSRFQSAISPYEPVYFDLGNEGGRNARFQVSLKYRLFTPDDPANPSLVDSLYLGYTQTSLWDLSSDSLPFVDTSFKPSLFWRRDEVWRAADNMYLGLATGVEHESNGKSGDESRSLNFAYIQPEFNYRLGGGSTLSFMPRIKGYFGMGNNRDYPDYAGHVDWKLRWAQDNGLILTGLYRHGRDGHSTTQLEAAWPLKRTFLNMNGYLHVQYFQGYGQTLLGYDRKSDPQVRVGIALVP